jgi:hypothetical protein
MSNCPPKNHCYPNLVGDWKFSGNVFRRETSTEEPTFSNIIYFENRPQITQKDQFLILKEEGETRMGVLTFVNNDWILQVADQTDNGVFRYTPKVRGDYSCWIGSYVEAGFGEPDIGSGKAQKQSVGTFQLQRQNNYCYCCDHY